MFGLIIFAQSTNSPFPVAEWNEAQFDSGQSAFSVEYDIIDNNYRLLHLETNTFCSGGGFLKNGTFISTGGGKRMGRTWKADIGFQSIRYFTPCDDKNCQWDEWRTQQMIGNRWYPSVEQMPEVRLPDEQPCLYKFEN
jgi:Glyoxal oxidase N-terminus